MRRIEDSSGVADTYKDANVAATPLGRYGEPDEVAAAVMAFLLFDEASFVTASPYTVDGGMVQQ